MKRAAQCLVAFVLLWLVVRNVDGPSFVAALQRLRVSSLTTATLLFFLACALAVAKWRLLWRRATWWQMLSANFVAQFYSVALPGQLAGEVVKTLRVGHSFSDTTNVAASVIVDRATGLFGIFALALGGALLSTSTAATHAVFALCVMVVGALCGLFVATRPGFIAAASSGLASLGSRFRWLRRLTQTLVNLLSAWASLISDPRAIVGAIILGIVYQALGVGINYTIATGVGVYVEFTDWCWVFGLASAVLLLPITIAGIGVREATYVGLLGLFNVSIEDAVLISLVGFGVSLIGVLIGGVLELLREPNA